MEHKGEGKEYKEVEAKAASALEALQSKIGGGDEQSASQFLRNNKAGFSAANIKKTDASELEQRFGQMNKVRVDAIFLSWLGFSQPFFSRRSQHCCSAHLPTRIVSSTHPVSPLLSCDMIRNGTAIRSGAWVRESGG